MAIKILMPALSPTMTEGNLVKWHKKEGDKVGAGDLLAEIETDKATMEVEAIDEGVLGKVLIAEGTENVKVNAIIAVLLEDGEDASVIDKMDLSEPKEKIAEESPSADAPKKEAAPAQQSGGTTGVQIQAPPMSEGNEYEGRVSGPKEGVFATPLAKALAEENDLLIDAVIGTGPNGRITKEDVEMALQTTGGANLKAALALPRDDYGMPPYVPEKNSNVRKVIAKRLTESKLMIPHFYLTVECELDGLLALRKSMNDKAEGAYKVSVNDFVIKASAKALKDVPAANVAWTEGEIRQYVTSDISVAVATDGGLITPILKSAEAKSLVTLSKEMKELAGKARAGTLKPHEFQGGTFSISNLGMFGIKNFQAIVNPPQGAILAVGAGEEKLVMKNGNPATVTVMSVTLSVDHRCIDGAVGAQFLAAFKNYIENPTSMYDLARTA